MSAPLNLTPTQLHHIAGALEQFSKATREFGVRFDAYTAADVRHEESDATFRVEWDAEARTYRIVDRIGD